MERELKFRGKTIPWKTKNDEYKGEWVYGYYHKTYKGECFIIEISKTGIMLPGRQVVPESVGQFIGLKAINNIEIYENDLISLGDEIYNEEGEPNIIEIVYDEETTSFRAYDYLGYQGSSLAEKWFMDDIIENTRVIGNTYENPELLDDKVEGCH